MSAAATVPTFNPLDPLALDAQLDDEERLIRDTVRQYVREKFLPVIAEHFERGTLPEGIGADLGKLGLLGMHLEGYGCAGASATAYGLTCLELEAGDSGLRSFCSVQGSLAMYAIHRWGSEEQKERWLPRMAAGETLGCFGLTEPDAGSNPAAMRTRAKKAGSGWVLNGSKMWITNGSIADVAVVWARNDDDKVNGFLVEKDTPGFSAPAMHHKLSLRASVTSELVLDGVEVPEENRLPEATSLRAPLSCLNEARFGIVFGAAGAARACYEAALAYAREREQFGKPIASYQLVQDKLSRMLAEITAMQLLCLRLSELAGDGRLTAGMASLAKMNHAAKAREIVGMARDILGGNGILLGNHVARQHADMEAIFTFEGTDSIQSLIVGREITGLNAIT